MIRSCDDRQGKLNSLGVSFGFQLFFGTVYENFLIGDVQRWRACSARMPTEGAGKIVGWTQDQRDSSFTKGLKGNSTSAALACSRYGRKERLSSSFYGLLLQRSMRYRSHDIYELRRLHWWHAKRCPLFGSTETVHIENTRSNNSLLFSTPCQSHCGKI